MACTHGNLGGDAQNQRLRMSIVALSVGLFLSVVLLESGLAAAYRGILFIPFFAAAFGAYQGLYRTCSFAARQGVRVTDQGEEVVANPAELDRMRSEGRKIVLSSVATAVAATLIVVLLP